MGRRAGSARLSTPCGSVDADGKGRTKPGASMMGGGMMNMADMHGLGMSTADFVAPDL